MNGPIREVSNEQNSTLISSSAFCDILINKRQERVSNLYERLIVEYQIGIKCLPLHAYSMAVCVSSELILCELDLCFKSSDHKRLSPLSFKMKD